MALGLEEQVSGIVWHGIVPYYRRKLKEVDRTRVYFRAPNGSRLQIDFDDDSHEALESGQSFTVWQDHQGVPGRKE